jgi:hypothetical protein
MGWMGGGGLAANVASKGDVKSVNAKSERYGYKEVLGTQCLLNVISHASATAKSLTYQALRMVHPASL